MKTANIPVNGIIAMYV